MAPPKAILEVPPQHDYDDMPPTPTTDTAKQLANLHLSRWPAVLDKPLPPLPTPNAAEVDGPCLPPQPQTFTYEVQTTQKTENRLKRRRESSGIFALPGKIRRTESELALAPSPAVFQLPIQPKQHGSLVHRNGLDTPPATPSSTTPQPPSSSGPASAFVPRAAALTPPHTSPASSVKIEQPEDDTTSKGQAESQFRCAQPKAVSKQPFNLFSSLLKHPELSLAVASWIPVPQLVSLYTVSKPFHFLLSSHQTTYILASIKVWAPGAEVCFPWRAYRRLCIRDPTARPNEVREDESRFVPSLRWLQMVTYRERACWKIMDILAFDGHLVPQKTFQTLKKIWFTMDISMNAPRIGLLHNREFWTDADLQTATMFFIKLDMRFNDPIDGRGDTSLRRVLLGQKSLEVLYRVLRREELNGQFDILKLFVRYEYQPKPEHRSYPVFGIAVKEIGSLCYEGWCKGGSRERLLRPDELVMREAIRRELHFNKKYLDMMFFGYVNADRKAIPLVKDTLKLKEGKKKEAGERKKAEEEQKRKDRIYEKMLYRIQR